MEVAGAPQIVIEGPISISNYSLTLADAAQISSLVALVGFAAEGLRRIWRYIWSS
ncbi:MAG: hypothetical protein J5J00_03865 [Deltaproteobacteria bacterium]|nr:hypothetical protein [Deltaproteobacteria bacterium]